MRKAQLIYCLSIVVALALGSSTQARPLDNVELIYFEAVPLDDAVRLEWATATEVGTAGFKLRRGADGPYTDLTSLVDGQGHPIAGGFIAAQGNPTVGSDYEATDATALNGQSYTYILVEIKADFTEKELAVVTVSAGPGSTATPIFVGEQPSATPGSALQPAATAPAATATAVATAAVPPPAGQPPRPEPALLMTATPEPALAVSAEQPASPAPVNATSANGQRPAGRAGAGRALAQDEPTAVNGYPGPTDGPPAATGEGYPGPAAPEVEVMPYPPATTDDSRPPPSIIGEEAQSTPETAAGRQATPRQAVQGRVFLWGGFTVALLLFLTGVVGSIVLFTRRQE